MICQFRGWATGCLLAAAVVTGCEHADPLGGGEVTPTFSSIQQNIFNTSCALSNCHLGAGAQSQLDLSAGNAYADLVGVSSVEVPGLLRVDPGNADDSYLVRKIEGGPGIVGARMPFGRSPLSSEQIQSIRDWIDAGAAED